MKKLKTLTYISFLLCILFSCNNNAKFSNKEVDSIKLGDLNKNQSFRLSQVFDSISYTILETNDKCLIGRCTKIIRNGDRYILGDNEITNSIYIFSNNGSYLNRICKIGQGPGEYLTITDFCSDIKGNIHILDARLKKILSYDKDGRFIDDVKLKGCDGDFIGYIDAINSFAIYSSYREYQGRNNLMIVNRDGKITNRFLSFKKGVNENLVIPAIDLSNYSPNNLLLCQYYDNIAYRIVNDKCEKALEFDFGEYTIPIDYIEREKISRNDNFCRIGYIRETENCIYYAIVKQNMLGIGYYFKSEKLNIFGLTSSFNDGHFPFENDIDNMPFYNYYGSYKNIFYSLYEISAINNNPNVSPKLKKMVQNLESESNPIVVSYHVKNIKK